VRGPVKWNQETEKRSLGQCLINAVGKILIPRDPGY
jgi:hypothetical protein